MNVTQHCLLFACLTFVFVTPQAAHAQSTPKPTDSDTSRRRLGTRLPKQKGATAKELSARCNKGDLHGCSALAYLMLKGEGTAKNVKRAKELFESNCKQGQMADCTNLGNLVSQGTARTPGNPKRARQLYRRACDGGHGIGCMNLAAIAEKGLGGPVNLTQAAALYRKDCDKKQLFGCTQLGLLTQAGRGVSKDAAAARSYSSKPALEVRSMAARNLASCSMLESAGPKITRKQLTCSATHANGVAARPV